MSAPSRLHRDCDGDDQGEGAGRRQSARRGRSVAGGSALERMSGGMLIPPGPIRVLMATKPVDFRKGMDGLAALVKEQLRADPFSGVSADRVKLIFWDGTGLCLFAKRLEGGKFRWPRIEDGVMRLSAAQLAALIEGLDWMRVRARLVPTPDAVQ